MKMKTKSGYSGLTDMNMKKKSSQKNLKSEIYEKKVIPKRPKNMKQVTKYAFCDFLNMKYEDFNGHKT